MRTAPAPALDAVGTEPVRAVGLDVGGTKIAGVRVDAFGAVEERAVTPTPREGGDSVVAAMVDVAQRLQTPDVIAVGAGVAGILDWANGVMRYSPNLPLRDLPIRDRLGEAVGLPCVVDNDANAAGWAEFRMGAGLAATDMLLVTVGTGIGGAIIAGGKLFRGAHGFAGEIGHFIVEPGGPLCGCGNRGCWEQVASGRAVDRLGRQAALEHPDSVLGQLAQGDPSSIKGAAVTDAARRGDRVAVGIFENVGTRLGEGIAGFVNALDPQLVVVGGGVMDAGDLLLEPARAAYRRSVEGSEHRPDVPIVAALMGNDAGAIGAGLLAMEHAMAAEDVE